MEVIASIKGEAHEEINSIFCHYFSFVNNF
jgi:hypothetical protein